LSKLIYNFSIENNIKKKQIFMNFRQRQFKLLESAQNGNLNNCSYLLSLGTYVNYSEHNSDNESEHDMTALHFATKAGHIKIVEELIRYDADINCMYGYPTGGTALHIAALNGNKEIIKILIENGADINLSHSVEDNPLHVVVRSGNMDMCRTLIEFGANYNLNALNIAIKNNRIDFVNFLLDQGAEIKEDSLTKAILYGFSEICSELIKRGANIESRSVYNFDPTRFISGTPIFNAVINKQMDILQILIEHGANIEAINSDGQTPLHYAALKYDENACLRLIANFANTSEITIPNNQWNMNAISKIKKILKMTPLEASVELGDSSLIAKILNNDLNPNVLNHKKSKI
jgi:ankyrin repeat protein